MMRLGCALLFAAVAGGCAARGLDWGVSFADDGLRSRARSIEAQILEGACPGTTLLYSVDLRMNREDTPDPPRLSEGRYCFSARAADSSCTWFAEAERTVDLPLDGDTGVMLTLAAGGAGAACPASACRDGECAAPPDAGVMIPGSGELVVAASCPGDTTCGGDPVGDWRYTGACSVEPSTAIRERCPSYTIVSGGGMVTGSLRVDGATATQSLGIVGNVVGDFPASCAPVGCDVLGLELTSSGGVPADCTDDAGGCRCDFLLASDIEWSRGYTLVDHRMMLDDGTVIELCVDGSTLTLTQTDPSRLADMVLELER